MIMITRYRVKSFKGIKSCDISDLRQVNIITGKNNVGKSAFLQSLYLTTPTMDRSLIPFLDRPEMFWSYQPKEIEYEITFDGSLFHLFYAYPSSRLYFDYREFFEEHDKSWEENKTYYFNLMEKVMVNRAMDNIVTPHASFRYKIELVKKSPLLSFLSSAVYFNSQNILVPSSTISDELDKLQNVSNQEERFLAILRDAYDLRLTNLRHSPSVFHGWSVLLSDDKVQRAISLESLGDGTRTCTRIIVSLLVNKPRLVLIDEIESHQHVKALEHMCKAVLSYLAVEKAQLFVSTHSLEAIKILLRLSEEFGLPSIIHHFISKDGEVISRSIPGLDARVVTDMNGDIRFADEFA